MNEPFVSIDDIAKHFSVSVSTVRAWIRQKHIPEDTYVKIGKTYRFRVGDVTSALTKVSSKRSAETVGEDLLEDLDEDL
jgi:excisionase family DNA binding protein|tara:strand:- start:3058 stop:3294 length:237 start_codon:yes stop_codon:yes gene_type:complete